MDCYDELGNHYQLPVYVLSAPINLIKEGCECDSAPSEIALDSLPQVEVPIKLCLSNGKDYKLTVRSTDTILSIKCWIQSVENIAASRQRIYFSGKQLGDKLRIGDAKISRGYTLQVIIMEASLPDSNRIMKE